MLRLRQQVFQPWSRLASGITGGVQPTFRHALRLQLVAKSVTRTEELVVEEGLSARQTLDTLTGEWKREVVDCPMAVATSVRFRGRR